jgi:hypothetical protein
MRARLDGASRLPRRAVRWRPNTLAELLEFIAAKMDMRHVYQPVLIRALVDAGGLVTLRQLAQAFLLEDEAELQEYEQTIRRVPPRPQEARGGRQRRWPRPAGGPALEASGQGACARRMRAAVARVRRWSVRDVLVARERTRRQTDGVCWSERSRSCPTQR